MLAADGVRITILVENWIDILIPGSEGISRRGLVFHFDPKEQTLLAENGLSLLIETFTGGKRSCVLFDSGLTADVIRHNFAALRLDPRDIDHIVISHGHLDHHGGLNGFLPSIGHPVPILVHPDAFLPRYAVMGTGEVAAYYNQPLDQEELKALGARFVLARDPVVVAPAVWSTGEIPRENDFEGPGTEGKALAYGPGIYQLVDGRYVYDEVMDEVGLAINVAGEGLVVITGCGHAGVINTVRRAQGITGVEELALVMGGFHLGFPGTPDEKIDKTVDALRTLGAKRIAPMHCSGFKCMADVARALPNAFFQYAVGTSITVGRV
ncbi:MAG TPA: MBL fold metallo-hydrolase [Gaiellaceae bacterium]|nr:MBL fold metallo-hydrolase [Gaiellaceae bacterium]